MAPASSKHPASSSAKSQKRDGQLNEAIGSAVASFLARVDESEVEAGADEGQSEVDEAAMKQPLQRSKCGAVVENCSDLVLMKDQDSCAEGDGRIWGHCKHCWEWDPNKSRSKSKRSWERHSWMCKDNKAERERDITFKNAAHSTQYPVPSMQYPVPSAQYPVLSSIQPPVLPHPAPSTQHPVSSSQYYPVPSIQYPVSSTQCPVPGIQ